MINGNASIMHALVIAPVLIGTVGTTRAESVPPQQQQAPTSRPSADMQIELLVERHNVARCGLQPIARCLFHRPAMLNDLPQRLSTRSKEQREAGAVIKSINYEVFADSAHCTTNVEKGPWERLELTASQAATKQPPIH